MEEEDLELELEEPISGPLTRAPFAAIFAGVVPFFIHWSTVQSVNGRVTSFIDYVAVAGGAVALILGGLGLAGALKATDRGKKKRLGLSGAALLLGLYHLARGFGLF